MICKFETNIITAMLKVEIKFLIVKAINKKKDWRQFKFLVNRNHTDNQSSLKKVFNNLYYNKIVYIFLG